jgi:hypothetical protein
MAHDHRMNPVGEPHLNKVNMGRSNLPRLTKRISETRWADEDPEYADRKARGQLGQYRLSREHVKAGGDTGYALPTVPDLVNKTFKERHN